MIVLLTAEACNTHTSKNRFVPILIYNSYIRVGVQLKLGAQVLMPSD